MLKEDKEEVSATRAALSAQRCKAQQLHGAYYWDAISGLGPLTFLAFLGLARTVLAVQGAQQRAAAHPDQSHART